MICIICASWERLSGFTIRLGGTKYLAKMSTIHISDAIPATARVRPGGSWYLAALYEYLMR